MAVPSFSLQGVPLSCHCEERQRRGNLTKMDLKRDDENVSVATEHACGAFWSEVFLGDLLEGSFAAESSFIVGSALRAAR